MRNGMGDWTTAEIEKQLTTAMGPHQKAELAMPEIAKLISMLWEARQLNLDRIDELRRRVSNLESLHP